MQEYMKILGCKVRDLVSGFQGIASTVAFDLYGCVQVVVTPEVNKDGKPEDGRWFDHKRLKVLNAKSVLPLPSFAQVPGGSALPPQNRY